MTTVAISQPMYFPWAGFLEMMKLADVFIWLDDAQFSKGSFTNRIQVKLPQGRKWMTVPLEGKGSFTEIRHLVAKGSDWQASHRALLAQSLAKRTHLEAALAVFDRAMARDTLSDILIASAEEQAQILEALPARRLLASSLDVSGSSWQRVIEMVKAVGGTRYISGAGGLGYIDHEAFEAQGLQIEYMSYNPRPWPQGHGDFTPYVTGLDLIAGSAEAASHLRPRTDPWQRRMAEREQADE
ncbi:MAG: WbqC family protein [Pseudomonadota bacterium]